MISSAIGALRKKWVTPIKRSTLDWPLKSPIVNTSSPVVNTSCPVVITSNPIVITSLSYTEYYNFLQSTIVRTIVFTSLCGKL